MVSGVFSSLEAGGSVASGGVTQERPGLGGAGEPRGNIIQAFPGACSSLLASWAVACAQGPPLSSFSILECPIGKSLSRAMSPVAQAPAATCMKQQQSVFLKNNVELWYRFPQKDYVDPPPSPRCIPTASVAPLSSWKLTRPDHRSDSPLPLTTHRAFADVALSPHSPSSQPSTFTSMGPACSSLHTQCPTGQSVSLPMLFL